MKAIISREQAARLVGGERKLQYLLLSTFTGKLAELSTGAKLFSEYWLSPNPVFEVRSGTCDSDGRDVLEVVETLE